MADAQISRILTCFNYTTHTGSENHLMSCICHAYRLLAVKVGTSQVGHLSPSAGVYINSEANDFQYQVGFQYTSCFVLDTCLKFLIYMMQFFCMQ